MGEQKQKASNEFPADGQPLFDGNYYEKVPKNQMIFDEEFGLFKKSLTSDTKRAVAKCVLRVLKTQPSTAVKNFIGFIPILRWLPKYNIRENLLHDVIGGLTVAFLHFPQGMAYASLAGLDPVNGLYTAFFPALFYMFFGTSHHISFGVFAVVSLMVGSTNLRVAQQFNEGARSSLTSNETIIFDETTHKLSAITPIDIAMTLTLCVGLIQIIMGLLRLDFFTSYMSDQVIAGFTTGAAVHVLVSQLNKLFGIELPRHSGFGRLPKTLRDVVAQLPNANTATAITSFVVLTFLYICKYQISPLLKKFIKFPIPFEIIVLVIGTVLSNILDAEKAFNMKIVGEIPAGLPTPSLPKVEIVPKVIGDAFVIAVVVIATSISLGKLLAKKHDYSIDVRQEFYAVGITECLCSLFPCWTCSAALARSFVNESTGTKTQLATIFSSVLMLLVLFFIGPLVRALPICFLACIIVVALKGPLMQISELRYLWPLSKADFAVWLLTFSATIIYDVFQGLTVGVFFALFVVVCRVQRLNATEVGRLCHSAGSAYYRPLCRYRDACYVDNARCLQFNGPIMFLNVVRFREACLELLKQKPRKGIFMEPVMIDQKSKQACHVNTETHRRTHRHNESNVTQLSLRMDSGAEDDQKRILTLDSCKESPKVSYVIVDLSSVPYVDIMGSTMMKDVYQEMKRNGIQLFYAGAQLFVLEFIKKCNFGNSLSIEEVFYPSVEDAVRTVNLNLQDAQ